jgi:opacity protein-like surface antigen
MRKIALAAALAVALAPAAWAQTPRGQAPASQGGPSTSVGFGVGVEPFSTSLFGGATAAGSLDATLNGGTAPVGIYVPIQLAPNLRLEPLFGYWHVSGNRNALGGNDNSRSATTLGLGALFYLQPVNPTGIYAGARLALAFQSSSDVVAPGVDRDLSETDFAISPVLGGEYAFAQSFTFGAEVQLPITFYGNVSDKRPGFTQTTNTERNGIRTNAVVFLRYFFL